MADLPIVDLSDRSDKARSVVEHLVAADALVLIAQLHSAQQLRILHDDAQVEPLARALHKEPLVVDHEMPILTYRTFARKEGCKRAATTAIVT